MSYAGFGRRLAAAAIDVAIILVASLPVGFAVGVAVAGNGASDSAAARVMVQIVEIVLCWAYRAGMESSPTQGTLGKMAIGIKVTDLEGNRIGFGRATGRHFGRIVCWLTLLIGYLMIAFTKRKQGLHDMMAECLVVDKLPSAAYTGERW